MECRLWSCVIGQRNYKNQAEAHIYIHMYMCTSYYTDRSAVGDKSIVHIFTNNEEPNGNDMEKRVSSIFCAKGLHNSLC